MLTDFVLQYQPPKAETKSNIFSLTAELNDQQIAIACSRFNGVLQKTKTVELYEVEENVIDYYLCNADLNMQ